MITVGLTGGIGSGKSEVARLLAEHGAVVIDSDALAREAVAPGTPGLEQVVEEFGDGVLAPDGSLDRAKLGAIVFGDDDRRRALEAIVHPYVRRRSAELVAAAAEDAVVVNDVPLLAEKQLQDGFDVVVVVDVSAETQVRRLTAVRGMTEQDVRARVAAQAGREERLALADHVIDNDTDDPDRTELRRQVDELWLRLHSQPG